MLARVPMAHAQLQRYTFECRLSRNGAPYFAASAKLLDAPVPLTVPRELREQATDLEELEASLDGATHGRRDVASRWLTRRKVS
jgi:hypothetical protein